MLKEAESFVFKLSSLCDGNEKKETKGILEFDANLLDEYCEEDKLVFDSLYCAGRELFSKDKTISLNKWIEYLKDDMEFPKIEDAPISSIVMNLRKAISYYKNK